MTPSLSPSTPTTNDPAGDICVPMTNVEEVSNHGGIIPADEIIEIVEQTDDGSSVIFKVYQEWKLSSMEWVAVEYQPPQGGLVCTKEDNVGPGPLSDVVHAKCVNMVARVTVYAYGDCFSHLADYPVPALCGANEDTSNIAMVFDVPCAPPCFVDPLENDEPTDMPTKEPTSEPTTGPTITPTSKPTSRPQTEPPVGNPTSSPTRAPTSVPTRLPTRAPTWSPTDLPTRVPTFNPTSGPTSAPTPCIPLMEPEEVSHHGEFFPADDIIHIIRQSEDGTTVVIQVSQEWKLTSLGSVAVQYDHPNGGFQCERHDDVVVGPIATTFTAKCVHNIATVRIYAEDDCFSEVPPYASTDLCGLTGENMVASIYHVPCTPGCGVTPLSIPAPSSAPTATPSFKPTNRPSRQPTKVPTGKPSKVPTSAPTPGPTLEPTICIPLLEPREISNHGDVNAADEIIRIIEQSEDGSTVAVQISQEWKLTQLSAVAIQYDHPEGGNVCDKHVDVSTGRLPTVYTAKCINNIATIKVYAQDDCFSQVTFLSAPAMCGLSGDGKISSIFEVPCTPGCGVMPLRNPTPTSAPTNTPTLRPTGKPSRVPTDGPTRRPTRLPTDQPTVSPTKAPTKAPTNVPTEAPTSAPTKCIPLVEPRQVSHHGGITPADDIIHIIQQTPDGSTVKVQISQEWKLSPLGAMAVQYDHPINGEICYKEEGVSSGPFQTFMAQCIDNVATIKVFGRDDCFSRVAHFSAPDMCELSGDSMIAHVFEVPCTPGCGIAPLSIPAPTMAPTKAPTGKPTSSPTPSPTKDPSTDRPTKRPTSRPTNRPTNKPTLNPTPRPTRRPTDGPTISPTITDAATPTTGEEECPYYQLDFNQNTVRGQYITDDFRQDYGVVISAQGQLGSGYTPNGAARIFDSSQPGGSNGDPDLGSPNWSCPGGGPGVGDGGKHGTAYENCNPLGMVLIIQETDKDTPDDNYGGGWITFDFDEPAHLDTIVIFDSDGCEKVELTVRSPRKERQTPDSSSSMTLTSILLLALSRFSSHR